jgi:hypothetical protein
MIRNGLGLAILALLAGAVAPAVAQTRTPWLQIGMLNCRLNPSIGFIIGGHQSMECRFTPNQPEPPQAYDGAINTVGLDVGFSSGGVLAWAVFARTLGAPAGSLAGEYVGVSSDLDIGIGGGANILVPRHSDYDWLILSQSRMGKSSGGTRIWMLLATPG